MPELSRFFGIIIRMMFNDSGQHKMPHIHVVYGEYEAVVGFDGEVIDGYIPAKQMKLVSAWVTIHEEELNDAWSKAIKNINFDKIAPLQ